MIKVMCNPAAPGAYCDLYWTKNVSAYNPGDVIYCREFAVGAVVAVREANYYDDSDFYAVYYDEATGEFKEECYATTRGWSYPNAAVVDAAPEVIAKYEALKAAEYAKAKAAKEAAAAKVPANGKTVKVVAAKGKAAAYAGAEGEVFWVGEDAYGKGLRVGVKFPDGNKVFVGEKAVEVVAVVAGN